MTMLEKWVECLLGDFITLKRGYDLPQSKRIIGDIPIISSSGASGVHNEAKVKGPGVVTGRYGTLGEVFFIEKDFWPLNTTLYVQDFKGSDPRFVGYFLRTLNLEHQNVAGAVPGVNRNVLHMMPVHVPPFSTQRKIAAILSAYDDLIENNTRRIKILEEMAQALYREWFVRFRFPGHEKVKMMDSPMGKIPEGWEVKKASDAIAINPKAKVSKEGEKPCIIMDDLSTNSMIIENFSYKAGNNGSKFKNSDTLFARITPCLENGKTGFVQILPSDDTIGIGSTEFIVLRSITLIPELVYLIARSEAFRDHAIKSMSGATGRQRVHQKCFDDFLIVQPDRDTLEIFKNIVSHIFKQVHLLSRKNSNLRHTRDLLLPKLISGELSVENLEIRTEG